MKYVFFAGKKAVAMAVSFLLVFMMLFSVQAEEMKKEIHINEQGYQDGLAAAYYLDEDAFETWGFIDKEGKIVMPFIYEYAQNFSEGMALVRLSDGKLGYIDRDGKVLFRIPYYDADSFFEGRARVVNEEQKQGYIDMHGELVIPFQFDIGEQEKGNFSEGLAAVAKDGSWGYIDINGNVVIPLEYEFATAFQNSKAVVYSEGYEKAETIENPLAKKQQKETVNGEEGKLPPLEKEKLQTAVPTDAKVLIDGKEVSFQSYSIADNNYFKLRDLAMALNGTDVQFEIGFDKDKNAVSLVSGRAYTKTGGELEAEEGKGEKEAILTSAVIYLDNEQTDFTVYTIEDNNYFKLRDLADALHFSVAWHEDTQTIQVNTVK